MHNNALEMGQSLVDAELWPTNGLQSTHLFEHNSLV